MKIENNLVVLVLNKLDQEETRRIVAMFIGVMIAIPIAGVIQIGTPVMNCFGFFVSAAMTGIGEYR